MIDQKRAEDIVRALRCTSTKGSEGKVKDCTYCPEDEIDEDIRKMVGNDVCAICDVKRIIIDAADMISALLEENDRLSEALMVLRIKARGDCGVCRHQHVNVREEPCASCIRTDDHDSWQYEGDEEHGEP